MHPKLPFQPLISLSRILSKAGLHKLAPGKTFGMYLRYLLLEPFRWADWLIDALRGSPKTEVIRPVFILGHWRSGTTHLQTLIAGHPNFACLNMYQAVFAEQFLSTVVWLKPLLQALANRINYHNPYHRRGLDWNEAQEEDLALTSMASPHSPYWARVLGRPEALKKIDPEKRLADHQRLVQKLQRTYTGKRLVLKSPPNLLFTPQLLATYPDAQFVFIHRDPLEVYHSTHKLWQATLDNYALIPITQDEIHQAIVEDYVELMKAYDAFRSSASEQQLIEVDYHKLKRNEAEVMGELWSFLDEKPTPFPLSSTTYTPQKYETPAALEQELREKWSSAWS